MSTKQFLDQVATSSNQERFALYQVHYQLSRQVMLVVVDHLVGGDYVLAAQSSTPYLMNKDGWNPIAASDMELWAILEFRINTLLHPEILDPQCESGCNPLAEEQIKPKDVVMGTIQYTQAQIQEVIAEIKAASN